MLDPKLEAMLYSKFTEPTPEMLSLFVNTLEGFGWITDPTDALPEITVAWEVAIKCKPLTIHDFALFIAFQLELDHNWMCNLAWKDDDDTEGLTDVGVRGAAKHLLVRHEAIAEGAYFLPAVGKCGECNHVCTTDSEFLAAMYKTYTNKVSTW
jgi:hypothetical protein